jgi:DNA-binding transcriptional LysR family regulator
MKRLERIAPIVDLQVRPKLNWTVADLRDGHEIDFAPGVMSDAPVPFSRITLFEDVYMWPCAAATCWREASSRSTALQPPSTWRSDRRGEATNLIDHVLESRGLERRMALTVNQFLVVPAIIGNTDLVATLFQRITEQLDILGSPHLVLRPLPLPPVQTMLLWHSTMTHHKAHRCMREVLVDSCRAL